MKLCLFLFILSVILFVSSIIILKNALAQKKELKEQLEYISDEPDIFLDFFK